MIEDEEQEQVGEEAREEDGSREGRRLARGRKRAKQRPYSHLCEESTEKAARSHDLASRNNYEKALSKENGTVEQGSRSVSNHLT